MKLRLISILLISVVNIFGQTNYQWHHLNGPMGGIIGDIAVDSNDILYAGVYSFYTYYTGIYKSIDNGNTWEELETQYNDIEVLSIFINNHNDIFLGTSGFGLHMSSDNGENWKRIDTGYSSREWFAIGENQYGDMFAGDAQYQNMFKSLNMGYNWEFIGNYAPLNFIMDKNNILFASTLESYIWSIDDGLTWNVHDKFKETAVSDILPLGDNQLILGTGYSNRTGMGVFKSYDGGATWELKGLQDKGRILSFTKDSKNNIYCGADIDGLYYSQTNGEDWNKVEGWKYGQAFRVITNSQDDLFVGSEYEGIYRSDDYGENFQQIGLPISKVNSIDFSRENDFIFTATPTGVQRFVKNSGIWENVGLRNIQSLTVSPDGKIFATTSSDGTYFSEDNGEIWKKLPINDISYNIKSINDSTLLLASSGVLYLSRDQGFSWITKSISTSFARNSIAYNSNSGRIIILGHNGSSKTIFLSNDFCTTFSEIEIDLSPFERNSIAIDNEDNIYLASNLLNDNEHGVYKSSPPYVNWQKKIDGLAYSVWVSQNNTVFAGMLSGVFQSVNEGENWQLIFNERMPTTFPISIITDDKNKLFIGTDSYGLFEMQIPTSIELKGSSPSSFTLNQNYPNPFNPSTMIKFGLPKESKVSLVVYNLLGQQVIQLVNQKLKAGYHDVKFTNSSYSSGIYFYRLQAGDFVETKKMILLK